MREPRLAHPLKGPVGLGEVEAEEGPPSWPGVCQGNFWTSGNLQEDGGWTREPWEEGCSQRGIGESWSRPGARHRCCAEGGTSGSGRGVGRPRRVLFPWK